MKFLVKLRVTGNVDEKTALMVKRFHEERVKRLGKPYDWRVAKTPKRPEKDGGEGSGSDCTDPSSFSASLELLLREGLCQVRKERLKTCALSA